jgi:hypothetical protein
VKSFRSQLRPYILSFVLCLLLSVYASHQLSGQPRLASDDGVSSVMPGEINLLLALGDKYLATNILVVRSIVSVGNDSSYYHDQSMLLAQAAALNSFHEDGFYQAAAALPWHGFVENAQLILKSARQARYFDPWPAFFEGFNEYYFNKDTIKASRLMLIGADRSTGSNKRSFEELAHKWSEQPPNYKLALSMAIELKNTTKSAKAKLQLQRRITRLENLTELSQAVDNYFIKYGNKPKDLTTLVEAGFVEQIAEDPLGEEYRLLDGKVMVGDTNSDE